MTTWDSAFETEMTTTCLKKTKQKEDVKSSQWVMTMATMLILDGQNVEN